MTRKQIERISAQRPALGGVRAISSKGQVDKTMASETNSTSRYSGNSTGNVWMNDPGEIDPFKKYFTPPDPRMARAQRASTFASLAKGISPEAGEQLRIILSSLDAIEQTLGYAASYIRNTASEVQTTTIGGVSTTRRIPKTSATRDQREFAQTSLDAQREIVQKSTAAANAAFAILKPRVLADTVKQPEGVTDAHIADRKADLIAAIEASGKVAGNALAQKLIQQAVADGDMLTVWVLAGDPMKFRAADLGLNQTTLQNVYTQAQFKKVGVNPLLGVGAVPGGELIQALPEIQALISETSAAVTQALNALAKECGLN
jgi:hypothetical protein